MNPKSGPFDGPVKSPPRKFKIRQTPHGMTFQWPIKRVPARHFFRIPILAIHGPLPRIEEMDNNLHVQIFAEKFCAVAL